MEITLEVERMAEMGDWVKVYADGKYIKSDNPSDHLSGNRNEAWYQNFYSKWAYRTYKVSDATVIVLFS